jgi:hypothetical protein
MQDEAALLVPAEAVYLPYLTSNESYVTKLPVPAELPAAELHLTRRRNRPRRIP